MEILGGILVAVVVLGWLLSLRSGRSQPQPMPPPPSGEPANIYELAARVEQPFMMAARPEDLLDSSAFQAAARCLIDRPTSELISYYQGDSAIMACLALQAICLRPPDSAAREPLLETLNTFVPITRFFVLRALDHVSAESIVGELLVRADPSWNEPPLLQMLREFVERRRAAGETFGFGVHLEDATSEHCGSLQELLSRLGSELTHDLEVELAAWSQTRIDRSFLKSVGTLWSDDAATARAPDAPGVVIQHEQIDAGVAAIESSLNQTPPRSTLVVGEPGVGKTALIRALGDRLGARGWTVFQAGAPEVIAGQMYIGALEERVGRLARELSPERRVLWYIPSFHTMRWAGQTQWQPTGALDALLPHIEQGNLVVVGELPASAFEQLVKDRPRVATALDTVRVQPLGADATLAVAESWAAHHTAGPGRPAASNELIREAWNLAQQYLSNKAAPGNLMNLLERTRERLAVGARQASADRPPVLTIDDLIVTLSSLSGLPERILDDRQGLDLDELALFFAGRVKGQREAIDCLVERVAMIKAGVTDPTRPQGVFLFAGPTGTGKTEVAKTLAEFLFGTPDRIVRVDMSELQTAESLGRLTGDAEAGGATKESLVSQIRKQPFAVVLLDEFEKAHPSVWDLFLQVFDDGRLTDRTGNVADFRHAVIILTSNLGARIPSGARLGFVESGDTFNPELVRRIIHDTFRPEFRNRLDRVVVFEPLGRETMRDILMREIELVFQRRGLRNREWAVEWEEAALEFLLENGFTIDLGARPLKRSIERYLLTPLAVAIVSHQFPAGDQFLFVKREGDQLAVEFVDPDAPESEPAAMSAASLTPEAASTAPTLGSIILEPRGDAREMAVLRDSMRVLRARVEDDGFAERKQAALARTEQPEFWSSDERFAVLGEAEYLDRIARSMKSAAALLERLTGALDRERAPSHLVARLAQQLYLLQLAAEGAHQGAPRDAFLRVEAGRDPRVDAAQHDGFAERLGRMYREWATKRRMQLAVLDERQPTAGGGYSITLAVSGFAAHTVLALEAGIHFFEVPRERGAGYHRLVATVRVAAQPDMPAERGRALAAQADVAMRSQAAAGADGGANRVVRRYRDQPSPLVRNAVRGYRTGRVDRVLDGDFDLIGDDATAAAAAGVD